jgi:hypothetical protein
MHFQPRQKLIKTNKTLSYAKSERVNHAKSDMLEMDKRDPGMTRSSEGFAVPSNIYTTGV